jgi:hypothetical protein
MAFVRLEAIASRFWLNRCQGLIGVLAALFAGFLAYRAALNAVHSVPIGGATAVGCLIRGMQCSGTTDSWAIVAQGWGIY